MINIHLRIISAFYSEESSNRIILSLLSILTRHNASNIQTGVLEHYYKNNGGEINIEFSINECKFELVCNELSDKWIEDVSDKRWANLFCEDVEFLWINPIV